MSEQHRHPRTALVVKSTGHWYTLSDSESGRSVAARLPGRLRLEGRRSTNPIVVGDRVEYQLEGESSLPLAAAGRGASSPDAAPGWDTQFAKGKKRSKPRSGPTVVDANHACTEALCTETATQVELPEESIPPGGSLELGVITRILPRHNYIIRRSSNLSRESHILAANIDQALVVATLDFPVTSFEFIDRFLVTAEAYHIPAAILLNKIDLYISPALQEAHAYFHSVYALAGYEVVEVEALSGRGVEELRERLKGRITLLSGNSGVGKSTLIGAVDPSLTPRVGAISAYHKRGKHTTTFSEMFALSGGGWLIDTPGIKGFGLIDLEDREIARYFPDLFALSTHCSYYNCTHTHEPDCAVKGALEAGRVSRSRYISYLKLLEDDEKYR